MGGMAKFTRTLDELEIERIVQLHVRSETTRAIAAEIGVNQSTISRLLRAPDVADRVAEERASLDAARRSEAGALAAAERARTERIERLEREESARERKNETAARRRRERQAQASPAAPQQKPIRTQAGADGRVARRERDLSYGEWLRMERELPERQVRVEYVGSMTPGTFGYYVSEEREHGRVADLLLAEGIGDDRNTLISALSHAEPGQTLVFRYEEPQPDEPPTGTFSTADLAL